MEANNLSPYGRTPINRRGYLDILSPRPVPVNKNDISFNTAPSAPTELNLKFEGGETNLSWKIPQNNGGHTITSWKIRYFHGKRFVCKRDVADGVEDIFDDNTEKNKDWRKYDIKII